MKFYWEKHVVSSFVSVLTLFALSFISISTVKCRDSHRSDQSKVVQSPIYGNYNTRLQ